MPCLLGCLALAVPRLVLFGLWLFTDYVMHAIPSGFWLLLGFLFMPLTTLAYAWAKNTNGEVSGIYLLAVIVAVLIDLGFVHLGRGGWRNRAASG